VYGLQSCEKSCATGVPCTPTWESAIAATRSAIDELPPYRRAAALAAAAQDRDASQQKALEALTQERDGLLEKVREVESARAADGEQHKQDLEAQVQRACEQEASRRAAIPVERVIEALDVDPWRAPDRAPLLKED